MARITDDEKWAPVIGRLFIAFGSIELTVSEILAAVMSSATFRFFVTQTLEKRISVLKAVLPESNLPSGDQKVLALNLDDVTRLADTRNLVAHNPLAMSFFDKKAEDGMTLLEEAIISYRDRTSHVKFADLMKHVGEAERLADALSQNRMSMLQRSGKVALMGKY